MFTYTLIPGGYQIFRDGALVIDQWCKPGTWNTPMTEAEAQAEASYLVSQWNAMPEAVLTA